MSIENLNENVRNVSKEVGIVMSIANTLRGPYKADKYKDVIIPMLIIRRIECALEATKSAVVKKYTENPNTPAKILRKTSGYEFYNTSKFDLKELTKSGSKLVTDFESYIDGFSSNIQDIINSLEFSKQIEKMDKNNRLFNVVKKFSEMDLYPESVSNIKMGYIFEEIIRRFSEKAGEAGDHYTPREVIRLLVKLMTAEGCDDILAPEKEITVLDMACGTGGMLSTTYDEILNNINPRAKVQLFGQENNPESYAICLADMLIKGQKADNICFQDTMKADRFGGTQMRFVIANPPFGQPWGGKDAGDGVEKAVLEEYKKGKEGRFFAGLPATGDMQLLFMQHAIYKMKKGIGRACIITNGSPLFSGGTTSGESQVRRYMLENDLIEAIVALPGDLFYNTGIAIYVFVLSKNKRPERKGKIQLINAVNYWKPLQKSLGKKRKEITPEQIEKIVSIYKNFDEYINVENDECKIFGKEEFLYKEWSVYQPLQRSCYLSEKYIESLSESSLFLNNSHIFSKTEFEELEVMDPRNDAQETKYQKYIAGKKFVDEVLEVLRMNCTDYIEKDFSKFTAKVKTLIKNIEGYSDSRLNAICMELSVIDKTAVIQRDRKGEIILDNTTKDTEIIKLSENVDEYFKKEVYPHVPDAIYLFDYDPNKKNSVEKLGAEFPFTKYFFKYTEPVKSEVLLSKFLQLEENISSNIKKL